MTPEYKPPPLPSPFNNTMPPPTLLTQGAEAHLYKTTSLDPKIPAALKIRPSKPYRHPVLDKKLTRSRIIQEARCLAKLVREGVRVPAVLAMDWEGQGGSESSWGGAWLMMEWIEGPVARVVLEKWEAWMRAHPSLDAEAVAREEERVKGLMRRIGGTIASLHKAGVVHGDLTTSNLMLRVGDGSEVVEDNSESGSMEGEVVIIDFGLASQSTQDEDRAVDLYVLERAMGSTHPLSEPFFGELLVGYKHGNKGAVSTLRRLEDVRMRGRKRSMLG